MTVIYIDCLFLWNTLTDYLLLLVTGRLAGIPLHRIRYLKAAVLGGFYAVIASIPLFHLLNSFPAKLFSWLLISAAAYGLSAHFLRLALLLWINACALAGTVLVLGSFVQKSCFAEINVFPPSTWLTLTGGLMICILVCRCFQPFMHPKISKSVIHTELSIAGKTSTLVTLLDTGNCLRDPVTGYPILVVSAGILDAILPEHLSQLLSSEHLQQPSNMPILLQEVDPSLCPQLIPYRALGVSSGMLLTIRADWIKINEKTFTHIAVALAPTPLGFGYSALWGGEI